MSLLDFLFGTISLCINGMNVEKFILILSKNKIYVTNIKRINYNHFELKTNCFYYKKLLEQASKLCYNISVIKTTGLYSFYCFFKKRLALFAMLVVGVSLFAINTLFMWKIEVNGNSQIATSKLTTMLNKHDIYIGCAKSKINTTQVEQLVYSNFNQVGLVSAVMYGNTLVINIQEKLYVKELETFEPLVATKNGVIKDVVLISGTLNCKVGDTVKKGDILVYPYVYDANNMEKPIIALAQITAYVDVEGRVEYNEYQTTYQKTGKSKTHRALNIFGLKINLTKNHNTYKNYNTKTASYYVFNNNLLPIKITKTTYYQTKPQQTFVEFEKVKQFHIDKSKQLAYESVGKLEVLQENTVISNNENMYYIITYLKTLQSIV